MLQATILNFQRQSWVTCTDTQPAVPQRIGTQPGIPSFHSKDHLQEKKKNKKSSWFFTHSSPTDTIPRVASAMHLVLCRYAAIYLCIYIYIYNICIYIYINGTIYTAWNQQVGQRSQRSIEHVCERRIEKQRLRHYWPLGGKSARIRRTEGDHPLCCSQRTPPHPLPLRCAKLLHYFTERRKKTVAAPRKCHLGHLESRTDVPNWLLNRAGSVWFPQKHLNAKASHECLAFNSCQWLCPLKQCEARKFYTQT